jgi:hypothetical protein
VAFVPQWPLRVKLSGSGIRHLTKVHPSVKRSQGHVGSVTGLAGPTAARTLKPFESFVVVFSFISTPWAMIWAVATASAFGMVFLNTLTMTVGDTNSVTAARLEIG